MTSYSIELNALSHSVWKGEPYSSIDFCVLFPSNEVRELFHDSRVSKVASFLVFESNSLEQQRGKQHTKRVACSRIEMVDKLILEFDGVDPYNCAERPYPFSIGLKLCSLFSIVKSNVPCIVAHIRKDLWDETDEHFHLQLVIEVKRNFPASYSISNYCKNFFSPVQSEKQTFPNDTGIKEEVLLLSAEDSVEHWWSHADDNELIKALDVIAKSEKCPVINAISSEIAVCEYKIDIEDLFADNTMMNHIKKTMEYEWYSSPLWSKLDVKFHLRDGHGNITYDYPDILYLEVDLVYEDGSKAPLSALTTKPSSSSCSTGAMRLLHPLSPQPVLGCGIGSCQYSFRIEQVSFHHRGHRGFRLLVYARNQHGDKVDVMHGCLDAVIIVKGKQTKKGANEIKSSSKVIDVIQNRQDVDDTNFGENNAIRELDSTEECTRSSFDSQMLEVPYYKVTQLFTGAGTTCLYCKADLSYRIGADMSDHQPDCRLAIVLSPYMSLARSLSNPLDSTSKEPEEELMTLERNEAERQNFMNHMIVDANTEKFDCELVDFSATSESDRETDSPIISSNLFRCEPF